MISPSISIFFTPETPEIPRESLSLRLINQRNIRMEQLTLIKEHLRQNQVAEAIDALDALLQSDFPHKDQAYYLRGNAHRKQADWRRALDDYQRAADLNPRSPAVEARRALLDILEFYNKDMFNQ